MGPRVKNSLFASPLTESSRHMDLEILTDTETEDIHTLSINEHYANAFEYKKEREELLKLKEMYGSDPEDTSEEDLEDAESEDEEGEELTPAVDAAILRTLARIKRKDPEIYETEKSIFAEEQKRSKMKSLRRAAKDKSKPITMRQVALESALRATSRTPSPSPVPHAEEQRALRSETIAAFHSNVVDDSTDGDDLLIPREKTKDEMEREEEEYRDFLAREVGEDLDGLVTVEPDIIGAREAKRDETDKQKGQKNKKRKGNSKDEAIGNPDADQQFLMNYILNRGWIDRSSKRIPTYEEITGSKKSNGKAKERTPDSEKEANTGMEVDGALQVDEDEFDDIAEMFESSYNFRFEEPDAATIKSYPRNLPSLVRREDTARKDARERKRKRKEEELAKKKEEVQKMKRLKMKELRAKLERVGREGGKNYDDTQALQDLDLEGDWDPDSHDRQMANLYGDDDDPTDEKPQWDVDIGIGDILAEDEDALGTSKNQTMKKKKKKKKTKDDEENEGVDVNAMDADVAPSGNDEEWDGTEEMRKRKLDEYLDEIYGLDFNDMVGDTPTRFKYIPVQPQSFALSPAEILTATDTELNQYLSVKKYAPYRKDKAWDKTRVDRLKELKRSVAERSHGMYGGTGANVLHENCERVKKRRGKRERQKMKAARADERVDIVAAGVEGSTSHEKDPSHLKRECDSEQPGKPREAGKRKRRRGEWASHD